VKTCLPIKVVSGRVATDFADAEVRLLCDHLRDIAEGALRTLVIARVEGFKADKEYTRARSVRMSTAAKQVHVNGQELGVCILVFLVSLPLASSFFFRR
jgi:hypothetical protein